MLLFFMKKIPLVLVSLLAPSFFLAADAGGGAGGAGGTETQDPPAPPPTEKPKAPEPPKPEGDTLEKKQESALGIIKNIWGELGQVRSQLATAQGERTKLEGQFNAVSGDLKKEKDARIATQGELETAKTTIAGLTTERDDANKNVERLEKLCNLRGVDVSQAVSVPANEERKSADEQRADLVSKLNKAADPLERGQIANQLREFDEKRKAKSKAA